MRAPLQVSVAVSISLIQTNNILGGLHRWPHRWLVFYFWDHHQDEIILSTPPNWGIFSVTAAKITKEVEKSVVGYTKTAVQFRSDFLHVL